MMFSWLPQRSKSVCWTRTDSSAFVRWNRSKVSSVTSNNPLVAIIHHVAVRKKIYIREAGLLCDAVAGRLTLAGVNLTG